MSTSIVEQMQEQGVVLGDGGYLIELERRGYVDSGSGREKVGTGKGSGQFTPEVATNGFGSPAKTPWPLCSIMDVLPCISDGAWTIRAP